MTTNLPVPGLVHRQIDAVDNVVTGQSCAAYRQACGLTGAELARRLCTSRAMINKLELGQRSWTLGFLTRYVAACDFENLPKPNEKTD